MDFAFHLLALVNCDLLLEKSFFTFPLIKDLGQVIHRKTFQWNFPISVYSNQDYGDGFFNQVFSYLVSCLVPCQGQEVFTISCPLNSCA